MPGFHNSYLPYSRRKEETSSAGFPPRKGPGKALGAGAAAAVALLLAGCGAPASLTSAAGPASDAATATPTTTPTHTTVANTPCTAVNAQQVSAGASYVCTRDESGVLVWLEAAESKRVTDKIAAAEAAKAAAEKAATEKAAADKAAADKAAADKAAADKAAADAAAAAAQQAAAARAAQDAAAKAAAEAAAKAAAPPAPVAPAVPGTNPGCDPNYSGCVPIASDVDCAGGSGNGPAYVRGPVQVIGRDIYGLDADHDGVGCE